MASFSTEGFELTRNSRKLRMNLMNELKSAGADVRELANESYQAHHLAPHEVMANSELAQHAIHKGGWNPDGAKNGIWLPADEATRKHGSLNEHTKIVKDIPGQGELPMHNGSHPEYNRAIQRIHDTVRDELIERYGSIQDVPPDVTRKAMHAISDYGRQYIANLSSTGAEKLT